MNFFLGDICFGSDTRVLVTAGRPFLKLTFFWKCISRWHVFWSDTRFLLTAGRPSLKLTFFWIKASRWHWFSCVFWGSAQWAVAPCARSVQTRCFFCFFPWSCASVCTRSAQTRCFNLLAKRAKCWASEALIWVRSRSERSVDLG